MASLSWAIGPITIEGNLVLAPMTRVTDLPFRLLCRDHGASLAFTEMVNVNAVSRGNKAAGMNFMTIPEDRPLGIQLFGTQPEKFLKTAQIIAGALDSRDQVFLDINLDCPVDNVVNQGAGAALLKRPERITAIINTLVVNQSLPVTAKMRVTAIDEALAVKTATIIEAAGTSMLTVHARTIAQKNSGDVQWNIIKAIKKAVSIPVIGNGGINSPRYLTKALDYSQCDAVMIGTSAMYNPSIFKQHPSDARLWTPATLQERLEWLQAYFTYATSNNCMKTSRFMERAKDFFKGSSLESVISDHLSVDNDALSILAKLTEKVNSK